MWRYDRRFQAAGHDVRVVTDVGATFMETHVEVDGARLGSDRLAMSTEPYRNNRVAGPLPDGRHLEVEAGYNSWWTVGMKAVLDGCVIWASHPGKPIALPGTATKIIEASAARTDQSDRLKAQWPSIAADIAIGLLFFLVAKLTDLRTAALVAAAAGLALVVAQRFVAVDLLGGMAMFGIVMTLLGAGFAILFEDDRMIQLRSTVLGGIGALLFLADGAVRGRYLGKRMILYMPTQQLDPGRLAIGLGLGGLVLAGLNLLVVELGTKDQWLFYTTFLDIPVALMSFLWATRFARQTATAART